jgi:hypothetical protein
LKDFQEDNKAEEMMRKINELEVRLGKIDSLEESVQKLQDSQQEGFNLLNKTLQDLGRIGSPDDDYRESPMIAGLRSSMGSPDGMNSSNRIYLEGLESFDTLRMSDRPYSGDGANRNLQKHVSLGCKRAGYETGRIVKARTSLEENQRGPKRLTSELWPITEENEPSSMIGSGL